MTSARSAALTPIHAQPNTPRGAAPGTASSAAAASAGRNTMADSTGYLTKMKTSASTANATAACA